MSTAAKITGISSTILLLFLLNTDPQELPSMFLILPFILFFIVLVAGVSWLLGAMDMAARRKNKLGAAIGAVVVLAMVLQSLGQLTLRDFLALLALASIAYFYSSRFAARVVR